MGQAGWEIMGSGGEWRQVERHNFLKQVIAVGQQPSVPCENKSLMLLLSLVERVWIFMGKFLILKYGLES